MLGYKPASLRRNMAQPTGGADIDHYDVLRRLSRPMNPDSQNAHTQGLKTTGLFARPQPAQEEAPRAHPDTPHSHPFLKMPKSQQTQSHTFLKIPSNQHPQNHTFLKMPNNQQTQSHPFLKIPKSQHQIQQSVPTRRSTGRSQTMPARKISPQQAVRKSKAKLVREAWETFNNTIFDINNEGDEEEDSEMDHLMERMLDMNWSHLHQHGVVPLMELAERED